MNQRVPGLMAHFLEGTAHTVSGALVGLEIETDFIDEQGQPISPIVTEAILASRQGCPFGCGVSLELGRQKIELAVPPAASFSDLFDQTCQSLEWLYGVARALGASPKFEPYFLSDEPLLYVTSERDQHWVDLDGAVALEHLCHCSSVQFTIDVNPRDAIPWINALWRSHLHEVDYTPNDRCWRAYMRDSNAKHSLLRYAGPDGFRDLDHYVQELAKFPVLMGNAGDFDLFLRSVWWHYRLRRHSNSLCLEVRPLARRNDEAIVTQWNRIATLLGLP